MKQQPSEYSVRNRRTFLKGALGAGLHPALDGCRTLGNAGLSRARASTYWCTWATQDKTLKNHLMTGELNFPGDQGVPGVRDNINDEVIFGRKGWLKLFPETRGDIMFLVDDGWDVPYGAKGGQKGIHSFGSLVAERDRFPSLGVKAADGDRPA